MKLDRQLQRAILKMLAGLYPYGGHQLLKAPEMAGIDADAVKANVLYLQQHGLVDSGFERSATIGPRQDLQQVRPAMITKIGLDFLADDGGLSAILGVVTVRLHEDTLKDLIGQRIAESDLPQPEKKRLLDQLRELPGETIKHLTLKLVDAGLANWPIALQSIETFVRSHGS